MTHTFVLSWSVFICCCFSDVCPSVCGRESRSYRANIQTAQGEDSGHYRLLYQAVSRVRRESTQANQDVPQIMPQEQEVQGDQWSLGCCKDCEDQNRNCVPEFWDFDVQIPPCVPAKHRSIQCCPSPRNPLISFP